MEHIIQTAIERSGDPMSNFQRRQSLAPLDGDQRLPADIDLLCRVCLRHIVALNAQLSDSVQDRH